MCCEHSIVSEDGLNVCKLCGLLIGRDFQTNILRFGAVLNRPRVQYLREHRLLRVLKSLKGTTYVPYNVVEAVSTVKRIRHFRPMLKRKALAKYYPKIPSIVRQLGFNFPQLSQIDMTEIITIFKRIERSPVKFSFTYLVPILLYIYDRTLFISLKSLLKIPSKLLHRKYDSDLFISLERSDYSRFIPIVGPGKIMGN
jgi:hypothetical protein